MSQDSQSKSQSKSQSQSNGAGTEARKPKQIESDLQRNRSRMDDMLDRLQARFSPDELIDQAKRYARSRTSDGSSSNLQEMVVRNPLPVALIGVGMAWLFLAGRNGSVPHEQDTTRGGNDRQSALADGDTPAERSERAQSRDTVSDSPSVKRSSDTAARRSSGEDEQSTRSATDHNRPSRRADAGADNQLKQNATGDSDKSTDSAPSKGSDSGRGSQPGQEPGQEPGQARAVASARTPKPAPR